MGLFDFLNQPQQGMESGGVDNNGLVQAMLAAASVLNPGYTKTPQNFGSQFAGAANAGMQTYQAAIEQKQKREERKQQIEAMKQQIEDRKIQQQLVQQKIKDMQLQQKYQEQAAAIPQTKTTTTQPPQDEFTGQVAPVTQETKIPRADYLNAQLDLALKFGQTDEANRIGTLLKTLEPAMTKVGKGETILGPDMKPIYENKADNPARTLENILATRVQSGEMSWEDATKARQELQAPARSADQALVTAVLRQQKQKAGLNEEPTATEVMEALLAFDSQKKLLNPEAEAQQTRIAGARAGAQAQATQAVKEQGGFASWAPEDKQNTFMYNAITGKPPVNAQGMGSNDRKIYGREYAAWQTANGIKAGDLALMQADYRAGDMSLKNMTKQEAPMQAFVGNINKQIDKIQQLYASNDRTGLRLIDLPVRELKVKAIGSGDEAVKASYLLEISNEIGKLSSGSSASVQQLSDSAKEDWKKVHDPNLSLKEIMKVVNATRDQANMRISTWREAKQMVRGELRNIGITEPPPGEQPQDYQVGGTYQGKKIKGINKQTRQLNVEGLGVVSY